MVEAIECACGCGNTRQKYDRRGRERRYIYHHQKLPPGTRGKDIGARICAVCGGWYQPNSPGQKFCYYCLDNHWNEIKGVYKKKYNESVKGQLSRKRYKNDNKNKIRARYMLANAIRDKVTTKPEECMACGIRCNIEAHHHMGYEPAYWLQVIWLCTDCHKKSDRK